MKKYLTLMSLLSTFLFHPEINFAQEAAGKGISEIGYLGTYTRNEGHVKGQAKGIVLLKRDPNNGELEVGPVVATMTNPSFVKISPDGNFLYAVSELGPGDGSSGMVYSFRINADHSLTEIGRQPTVGYAPCHIAMDTNGNYVFVSNYSGGVVVMYERLPDGNLQARQTEVYEEAEESHPHSVTLSPDNQHVYVADLGYDRIRIYDFDAAAGLLTPNKQPFVALEKGAGPRHLAFSKGGDFVYAINELNNSISAFGVKADGGLELLTSLSSLPADYSGESHAADIHLHPSGKYLYVSNRGHNSIAAFAIDEKTGRLTVIGFTDTQGDFPRNFAISDDGDFLYVANQNTNTISTYRIGEDGGLKASGAPVVAKTPVCIEFE